MQLRNTVFVLFSIIITLLSPNSYSEQPILWGERVSPFVTKVSIVLAEKDIQHKHIEVLPVSVLNLTGDKVPARFEQISPLGKVPAFEYEGFGIADSAVISEYIEYKFPDKVKLIPKKPEKMAKVLWIQNYADNILSQITIKKIFIESFVKPELLGQAGEKGMVKKAIEEELPPMLDYLQNELGDKKFIVGDKLTLADIALATHYICLNKSNVKLDKKRWGKLINYLDSIIARESFQNYLVNGGAGTVH